MKHTFENIMPNYTEISIAVIFVLLSIFVTYPNPSLLSYVKAAAGSQTPCGEWIYYDKEGQCRSCEIPCGNGEEECRAHGCLACKPDEYLETTLGKCRPCSIPCSMSAEQCQAVGCSVTTPRLPTPDLPDPRGPPIFAKNTPDPDNSDSTGSTLWMAIVFPIMAIVIVSCCAVFWGKRVHVKYKRIGRRKLTPWQRRVLTILETCQNIYERIFPPNTRNEQRDTYDGGPRSDHPLLNDDSRPDHPLIHEGRPAVPDRDPESLEPTRDTTPAEGIEEQVSSMHLNVGGNQVVDNGHHSADNDESQPSADINKGRLMAEDVERHGAPDAIEEQQAAKVAGGNLDILRPRDSMMFIDDECADHPVIHQGPHAGTVDDGSPRSVVELINEKSPGGDPENLEQGTPPAEGATPAEAENPAEDATRADGDYEYFYTGSLDDGSPQPDDRLNEEVFPGERPEILQQSAIPAEGANHAESLTPAKDNDQSDPRTADDSGPQSDDRLMEDLSPGGDPKVLEQGAAPAADAKPAEDATPAECANSESNDHSHAVTADNNPQPGDRLLKEESPGGDPAGDPVNQEQCATAAESGNSAEDGTAAKDNDQSETGTADDGGPRSKDKHFNEKSPGGNPAGDPKNLEEGSTPEKGATPAEGNDRSDAETANDGGLRSDEKQINEESSGGNLAGDPETLEQRATPADGANPAEGNGLRDPRAADNGGPPPDVMLTNDEYPSGDHLAEDPDNLEQCATPNEGATPVEENQRKLNNTLAAKLDTELPEEKFERLKGWLQGPHGIKDVQAIEKAKYTSDLIGLLIKNKKIVIGKPDGYSLLIEGLELFDEQVLAEMVKDYQLQIFNAGNPKDVNQP